MQLHSGVELEGTRNEAFQFIGVEMTIHLGVPSPDNRDRVGLSAILLAQRADHAATGLPAKCITAGCRCDTSRRFVHPTLF